MSDFRRITISVDTTDRGLVVHIGTRNISEAQYASIASEVVTALAGLGPLALVPPNGNKPDTSRCPA